MKPISTTLFTSLLCITLAGCGGDDDGSGGATLEFRGAQAFLPGLSLDTGWLPADSPAAVRATLTADGELAVRASASSSGETLEGIAGSGELSVGGALSLEVSARIDASGIQYEGVVESFGYTVEPATAAFDPFAIGETIEVTTPLPAQELGEVPIPSVPGASLRMEVTGGELTSTFVGTCAESDGTLGQYTGATTMTGTVACAATIVIEVPILGDETFGPFDFDVPIPPIVSDLDLGTYALATGEPAAGGPCLATSGTSGADGGDSDGSDDGVGPAGAGDSTSGDAGETGSADTGSGNTGDTDPPAADDPDYPRPDATGCPGDDAPASVTGDDAVCLPTCDGGDSCPNGATGSATGVCALNPGSSYAECTSTADCFVGETCLDSGVCALDPTHCVLTCRRGTCPDAMACVSGFCTYTP